MFKHEDPEAVEGISERGKTGGVSYSQIKKGREAARNRRSQGTLRQGWEGQEVVSREQEMGFKVCKVRSGCGQGGSEVDMPVG